MRKLIFQGDIIHLKPHPDLPNLHSFINLDISNEIYILKAHYPAELIMNYYKTIYIIDSNSNTLFFDELSNKILISKLLIFNNDKFKLQYDNFHDSWNIKKPKFTVL